MLWYIIISKLESDRHPFFSDQREYLTAWVEDRAERLLLARFVSEKIWRIERENREMTRKLEWERESNERMRRTIETVDSILQPYGIQLTEWGGWEDQLIELLRSSSVPNLDRVAKQVQNVASELTRIAELMNAERGGR
ncbi:MAG: hypothetical protein K6T83_06710 [Alicyclobacillus sp.]|nr:hypothetical protein [Alicyclobacillus sp.]